MIKIGLTGGIGSGKSFVSKIIEALGFPVFYSDDVAKSIISTNTFAKEQLISYFGEEVFKENQLDRTFLASIIFNNQVALEKVNQLIHPLVREEFEKFAIQQKTEFVFNEAAILFESGGAKQFDKVIIVSAPKDLRIQRVMNRDKVTKEEVLIRMGKQWSNEKKEALSDFIIYNDGKSPVLTQIEKIIKEINLL